ncbi:MULTISPECIES: 2-C-methyl-D-erythritol 4-phosphate cytidylyltransferase [Nitrosomonas]|uniref:2-C-methyl-D-erythritol 4-phosphate cytidylyltransferase n=1 Tax=Nitrosomonas communis TaxID=44574 RepID=A0A0F7KH20_9PROT|nr:MULTISPECIES: 2-C-methyl-D-erythritol 4-phosphate cytidylyltransferase [Nitrosomonas]AKH38801.1 2-C-methyl-D-erythritol 4-phosphate cytidylyltransferase [Nitrosomonas communis]TYP88768.1 2-C-methyl-D-erythritol 4-phosphate cytidylyltransferase [Nitrosomonas communis]UVS60912.1 2-C-methyl-D-erythritol 4-phosphate cytidylyltransferase [Nitrosomonas sp. PLL12]
MPRFIALIPAAGTGSRMNNELPKQYLSLAGKPMIYHALHTLCHSSHIFRVFVILAPDDHEWNRYDWSSFADKLVVKYCGGATRADSVLNGLKAMQQTDGSIVKDDWILVHDAARPCLTIFQLDQLIDALALDEVGGLLAIPVADTLKRADLNQRVMGTESRNGLWQAQTPQMFRLGLLMDALSKVNSAAITDDASAIEALGLDPRLVLSDAYNFKVTYPQDLALAELILQKKETN